MPQNEILDRRTFLFLSVFLGSISLVLSLVSSELLWAVLSVVYLAQVYGIWKINLKSGVIRNLTILILVPLFLGSIGLSSWLAGYIAGIDIAFVVIIPMLALTIIFNLNNHTSFQSNLFFTVSFVILFSLAVGGSTTIIEYFSDHYLNTNFILGNDEEMLELLVISISGIIAGISFKKHLENKDSESLNGLNSEFMIDSSNLLEGIAEILQSGIGIESHDWILFASKILQFLIVILGIYAALTLNIKDAVTALLSISLTMVPYLYNRKTDREISPLIHIWISGALFLHVVGGAGGLYEFFIWWDKLTHFTSGTILALIMFFIIIYARRVSSTLYIPSWLVLLFVITFMFSMGVMWEFYEFFGDQIFGTAMQESLHDTIYDMIYNVYGALFFVLVAFLFFPSEEDENYKPSNK